jgi:hypothetical protein
MEHPIEIIREKIGQRKLKEIAAKGYGHLVKVAVDIEKEILSAGGEFHADGLEALIQNGCRPQNIWGANIYLDKSKEKRIEFVALINIRPAQNNRAMEIQDLKIKNKVKKVIDKLIE